MNAREVLERPFAPELVKTRPGRNGDEIRFLEGHVVVGRLNEAFASAGDWSWIIEKHEILEDEVIVLGQLTAGTVNKSAFGGSSITRTRDGGRAVSISDDLKAAATDALKKAATLLGVGLTLHATTDANLSSHPQPSPSQANGNGFLSAAQLRAIHAIRRKLGWSEAQLADFAGRATGDTDVEKLDKRAASSLIEKLQAEANPVGATR